MAEGSGDLSEEEVNMEERQEEEKLVVVMVLVGRPDSGATVRLLQ